MCMVRCDQCEHLIDSDVDPDCFISFAQQETILPNYSTDATLCASCRETFWEPKDFVRRKDA